MHVASFLTSATLKIAVQPELQAAALDRKLYLCILNLHLLVDLD